ncbi:3-oxoacyl-[acyl-carrier-protein] reductase FabG [Pirellula sp. SH-Sr6A]|uniref:SDR family NAD(P)-dependent oxidoreductase n=1 Tax=Pirellula sp. SH-Sr6A TaxID=1632865 RepID=UPI00078CC56B|nr:SDR family oxidoreductase [Pirellula sp. SH-Sr6A]AMV31154.1 3-oxoacyl-[acyl-carrier-protein] reductase FabG [Pirellula sp. SH-Sr6A]
MTSTSWALITGASSGIGQTIAIRLARAGFRIVVNHFRDITGATRTLEWVKEAGSDGVAIDADVGSGAEVAQMFEQFDEIGGALRVLVNNAGVQTWAGLLDLQESDFDRTIRTNLKGTFLCMQQAGRRMRDGGAGAIINIGSGANRIPFPNLSDYCASKGGIEMLTKCAATELGPMGIRVNCVAPGAIENERTKAENPEYAKTWGSITPLRRCGVQDDVAEAVLYFATDASPFVTGQILYVDGGLWTRNQWPYE